MRPKIWPYIVLYVALTLLWSVLVIYHHYDYWRLNGEDLPFMGRHMVYGLVGACVLVVAGYAAHFFQAQSKAAELSTAVSAKNTTAVAATASNPSPLMAQTGEKYVLEVRAMSAYVGEFSNYEIWERILKKADNHLSYISTNPEDFPDGPEDRSTDLRLAAKVNFRYAATPAVTYWPMPAIAFGPPKDKTNSFRAAEDIAGGRQAASLGVTLFLWEDDANTDDGAAIIEKLFAFFDAHPDVPEVLIMTTDGSMTRALMGARSDHGILRDSGHIIPAIPDSLGGLLVTRSDRVDRLIRPFAVDQQSNINKTKTDLDVIKLWNFFWAKNNDGAPGSFEAQYKEQARKAGVPDATDPGFMSSSYWKTQLPQLLPTMSNKGPGNFVPSDYIPIRWTNWQVAEFDKAKVLAYLHRPVDVKLTDDHGKLLKTAQQAAALKAGWEKAVAALPDGKQPKRVFYDTTGDPKWVIPINQALMQVGDHAPDLDNVEEGYNIGARIANTGIASPLIQIGMGILAGYVDQTASATINRRPDGTASIIMVSPSELKPGEVRTPESLKAF